MLFKCKDTSISIVHTKSKELSIVDIRNNKTKETKCKDIRNKKQRSVMDAEMRQLKFLLYVSLGCTTIFAVLTIK